MAAASLKHQPAEILMVAAHNYDLNAAKAQGFRTAFVARPHELGPAGSPGNHSDPPFDFNATSLLDLAQHLVRLTSRRAMIVSPSTPRPSSSSRSRGAGRRSTAARTCPTSARRRQTPSGRVTSSSTTDSIASALSDVRTPPMMYFTVNGHAPAGPIAGEGRHRLRPGRRRNPAIGGGLDCHRRGVADARLRQQQPTKRKANAVHAVTIIKRYGFTHSVLRLAAPTPR